MINSRLFINQLAANTNIWGTTPVNPPGGGSDLSEALAVGVNVILIMALITSLIWGLWGALDWITAGGTKEQLEKAQGKIRNAFLGLILLVIIIAIWATVTGKLLGIVRVGPGWEIPIPHLGGKSGGGAAFDPHACLPGQQYVRCGTSIRCTHEDMARGVCCECR